MISGIPLKLHKNVNPTKTRDDLRSSLVLVGFRFLCNFNGMPEIIPGFSGVHVFM
jgi:hypothetical protein